MFLLFVVMVIVIAITLKGVWGRPELGGIGSFHCSTKRMVDGYASWGKTQVTV